MQRSVAYYILTTEVAVVEIPEKDKQVPQAPGMGMDGMY